MTTQHAGLSPRRWGEFTPAQQILMIANELNRAGRFLAPEHRELWLASCERVLNLVDLTATVRREPGFLRELLRWRDLVAAQYIAEAPDPSAHRAAMRALLYFTPESARQLRRPRPPEISSEP